jgi:hypothetical protein
MTTRSVVKKLRELLSAEDGLAASLRETGAERWDADAEELAERIREVHASAELIEKSFALRKTTLLVYCRRYTNQAEGLFRGRGGRYEVVVEILATQDRLELLRPSAMEFADAVVNVIQRKAGCIGDNLALRERVEVGYEGAKKGGLNLMETARVTCTVDWSEA